jgi:lipoprotein-releasing system ATP-binding protein
MSEPVLTITDLCKEYPGHAGKNSLVRVFSDLELEIDKPGIIAIMGESGAGKSTLLNLIGLLDNPTSGEILYFGKTPASTILDRPRFRNERIGFVFQNHLLLEEFTALENVMMPVLIGGGDLKKAESRARNLLSEVGLEQRLHHRPGELSGGECQRTSIARALINDPDFILADEPTGNLDFANQKIVNRIFLAVNHKLRKTVLIATHSRELAAKCQKIYMLTDGKLKKI